MADVEVEESGSGSVDWYQERRCQERRLKLCKRLCYMLRYGAEKAGLQVSASGYVELGELLRTPPMRHDRAADILSEVEVSQTAAGRRRFEMKKEGDTTYIRALYGRKMERNPYHEGTKVTRLLESCISHVADNIKQFDLQDFPDDFLTNCIIKKLKQSQRLSNAAFGSLLGINVEHLDLGGTMVTASTLRMIGQRCPLLKDLNLRESNYVLNDHIMEGLLKKFKQLERLNLSGCCHLTDRTVEAIVKNCPQITTLNLNKMQNVSQDAILNLVTACQKLSYLDIIDNPNIKPEGMDILSEAIQQREMTIILKANDNLGDNSSSSVKLAGDGEYW